MRIRIITPITTYSSEWQPPAIFAEKARPDALISNVYLEEGPASIECIYEDSLAAIGVVKRAIEAERDGVDAVIIDCMNDPGLEAAREAVSIPVVGAAQSSMMLASLLAYKFSVIGTAARDVYPTGLLVRRYGLKASHASTRWVDIPVLDIPSQRAKLLEALVHESELACRQDGAQAIVFGCTGMRNMVSAVQQKLHEKGLDLPVIDPSLAALKWAETLVDLGLNQSRWSYPLLEDQMMPEHMRLAAVHENEIPGQLSKPAHIQVMVPVVRGFRDANWLVQTEKDYATYARKGTTLRADAIESGPATIETYYLKSMAVPGILRIARAAEKRGATALVIDCMSDPSLDAAREASSVPVVGPAQASAYIAASQAHRFTILGTRTDMGHKFATQMEEYGISSKMASVRTVGLSVQAVESDPEAMFKALLQAGQDAVIHDGAHILIPGCTGMIGIAKKLRESLYRGGIDVPVIEAPAAAVKIAEALSDLGLTHSKATYPLPPAKALAGFEDLQF